MAKVRAKRRKQRIKIQHKRRRKLAKLRQAYSKATETEKKAIFEKVKKLSPKLSLEEFITSIKKK